MATRKRECGIVSRTGPALSLAAIEATPSSSPPGGVLAFRGVRMSQRTLIYLLLAFIAAILLAILFGALVSDRAS